MRFYVLNKKGHTLLKVKGDIAEKKFNELKKRGYEALTKDGKKVENCPSSVEDLELIWGKPRYHDGNRGN